MEQTDKTQGVYNISGDKSTPSQQMSDSQHAHTPAGTTHYHARRVSGGVLGVKQMNEQIQTWISQRR